jgi:hypothetical protein
MSKKKVEPEPELSFSGKRRSLRHLSIFGAGLVDDLEARCTNLGLELERYNPDGVPTVQDSDLESLIGDQAESIRASLDGGDYIDVPVAAKLAKIHPTAVEGLAKLRGVPVCHVTGETQVHRIGWDNLVALLTHEQREHYGRDLEGGKFSWGLMNRHEIAALREALPGFGWSDPWRPKPPPELSPFQKAVNTVKGDPDPRPAREMTDYVDRDCEFRTLADAIGVRWKWDPKLSNRADFLLYDLSRLTAYDFEKSNPGNARVVGALFRGCICSVYASVFPETDMARDLLRADLVSRFGLPQLAAV